MILSKYCYERKMHFYQQKKISSRYKNKNIKDKQPP